MKKIAWTSDKIKNQRGQLLPPEEIEEEPRHFDDFDYDGGYSEEEDDWITNSNSSYNYSEESVDHQICRTKYGAVIEVNEIPIGVLDEIKLFYVCEQCGKCYWDGSHRNRALGGFIGQIVRC